MELRNYLRAGKGDITKKLAENSILLLAIETIIMALGRGFSVGDIINVTVAILIILMAAIIFPDRYFCSRRGGKLPAQVWHCKSFRCFENKILLHSIAGNMPEYKVAAYEA